MKHTLQILSLIALLSIYSCSTKVENNNDKGDTKQDQQATINSKNDVYEFSVEQIGENSKDKSRVELIGIFENVRKTEDHSYGYTLSLWKIEKEIVGFFNLYEGSLEPDRNGPIVSGQLIDDSLHLTIWTKQSRGFSGWQQSEVHIFSFSGKLKNDKLIGHFFKLNCSDPLEKVHHEQVELNPSDLWELKSFENIQKWKENYRYELDYNE